MISRAHMGMRIIILGSNGMLGHMVERVLASAGFSVRGITRQEFDCTAPVAVISSDRAERGSREISFQQPLNQVLSDTDYVINCIGITARHIDDHDPASVARAIRVNAEFPHALAAAALAQGVRVIHMSTDGVFSGNSETACTEDAIPDAQDTYGRTKLLGESAAANVFNIRTSIIGPSPTKHEGLWEWIAQQPDGATIQGYTNHIWHGVTTRQFAEFVGRLIREDRFDALRLDGHVLHLAPNAPCTKYDLCCAIRDTLGKRFTIESVSAANAVHRILATRSSLLREMLGPPQSIFDAITSAHVMEHPAA